MPTPRINSFYAHEGKTPLAKVSVSKSFALSWTCTDTVRLSLVGPNGPIFDQQDAAFIDRQRSWQICGGITDTATFLLTAANPEGQHTQHVTLFVPNPDKTFRKLTVLSTLTLEKPMSAS
ncbi:hypothetical protein [Streptomyces sp. NPDC059003]|uniref:hypothetical protein n=1 Tax=Streptomyces sp. NPDC059003 TaxID=3346691 RepID=UPI0036840083